MCCECVVDYLNEFLVINELHINNKIYCCGDVSNRSAWVRCLMAVGTSSNERLLTAYLACLCASEMAANPGWKPGIDGGGWLLTVGGTARAGGAADVVEGQGTGGGAAGGVLAAGGGADGNADGGMGWES